MMCGQKLSCFYRYLNIMEDKYLWSWRKYIGILHGSKILSQSLVSLILDQLMPFSKHDQVHCTLSHIFFCQYKWMKGLIKILTVQQISQQHCCIFSHWFYFYPLDMHGFELKLHQIPFNCSNQSMCSALKINLSTLTKFSMLVLAVLS